MCAGVTVRVCIGCGRKTRASGERSTTGLLSIQTELKRTWPRIPKASETSCLLLLETLEEQAAV